MAGAGMPAHGRPTTLWVVAMLLAHQLGLVFAGQQRLTFRQDKTFKIVVFTDIHYGEGEEKDLGSLTLQRNVLEAEQPDLVVFSGDLVSGWYGHKKRGWMESKMRKILEYPNSQGYPHAIALGNHDAEADLDRARVLEEDKRISGDLSYSQVGPTDITGASNYYIDIYSGIAGQGDRVDARLWFFDSMNRGCEGEASWGCVARDTIEWYSDLNDALTPVDQQIAFVHIPLPEHRLGYGDFRSFGGRQEDSACPVVNTGLAKELALNSVNMVVSGHDHRNDFVGNINLAGGGAGLAANDTGLFSPSSGTRDLGDVPMLMAYARKSGYGSYGPGSISRGARVIELQTFSSVEEEQQQTQELVNRLNSYVYYYLAPQFMHDGPFKWMNTWITDETGVVESNSRPVFKYQVQPMCYNGACTLRGCVSGLMAFVLLALALGL